MSFQSTQGSFKPGKLVLQQPGRYTVCVCVCVCVCVFDSMCVVMIKNQYQDITAPKASFNFYVSTFALSRNIHITDALIGGFCTEV